MSHSSEEISDSFGLPVARGWAMRRGRKQRIAARRGELGGEGGCGRAVVSRSAGTGFGRAGRRLHDPHDGRHDGRRALGKLRAAVSREVSGCKCDDIESLWWGQVAPGAVEMEREEDCSSMWSECAWQEEEQEQEESKAYTEKVRTEKLEFQKLKLFGGGGDVLEFWDDEKLAVAESTCASVNGHSGEEWGEQEEAEETAVRESSARTQLTACARAARWEEAKSKAEAIARSWLRELWEQERREREEREREKGERWEEPKFRTPWERFQQQFLEQHGRALQLVLAPHWGEVDFEPVKLPEALSSSFLKHRGEKAAVPVVHGTAAANIPEISKNGMLIPGRNNAVRVANGSAHGVGIYTAAVDNAVYSCSYCCSERRMLFCAVLDEKVVLPRSKLDEDPSARTVTRIGGVLVIFDTRRVLPLFEAFPKNQPPLTTTAAATRNSRRAGARVAKVVQGYSSGSCWQPPVWGAERVQLGTVVSKRTGRGGEKCTAVKSLLLVRSVGCFVKRRLLRAHREVSEATRFLLRRAARKRRPKVPAGLQACRRS